MSDVFNPVTDSYTFVSDDQVQIPVSFVCAPLSYVSTADLTAALAGQQAIKSVLSVEPTSLISELNPFGCNYTALVNPVAGVSAADLRNAMYTAMNQANQGKVVRANNIQVGQIAKLSSGIFAGGVKGALDVSTSTTVSLVAIAILALVGGLVFFKLNSEI
jgi:hypothetical protein